MLKTSVNINSTYNNLPFISEHVPNHNNTFSNEEFGFFLAGLIEGRGQFEKKELHIIFSEEDTSLAYFIKKKVGFGNIYKIYNKNVIKYVCKNIEGLSKILYLTNGKFVCEFIYKQLIMNEYNKNFNITILPPRKKISLDNYWLAGFTQANGNFHIKIVDSKSHKLKYNIILEYYLSASSQNDKLPLELLCNLTGKGSIDKCNTKIWGYKSLGYTNAAYLINYFDKFNLFAGKYISYLKFRKVYIMIREGKHLKEKGLKKIKSIVIKGSSETSTQEI